MKKPRNRKAKMASIARPALSVGIIDRVNNATHFADGIKDAVFGVAALSDTECCGLHALLDAHIENLKAISAELSAAA